MAGLLRLDVDSSTWVQPPSLEWLNLPRQEQWLWLVNAWLASERAPSLVGQPLTGPRRRRPRTRGEPAPPSTLCPRKRSGPTPRWSASGSWRSCTNSRRRPPRRMAKRPSWMPGCAAAGRVVPAADVPAVQFPGPRRPRGGHAPGPDGFRGVDASWVLPLPMDQPEQAMTILGEHLPAAVNHILLQADLTAVAPDTWPPN